jgi:hypothetical protein
VSRDYLALKRELTPGHAPIPAPKIAVSGCETKSAKNFGPKGESGGVRKKNPQRHSDRRHAVSYSSANDPMDQARQQTGGF